MPRVAKYKYTGLTGQLRDLMREAPTRGRPDKVTKDWLRTVYGASSNGETIISVLRFVGLIGQNDGRPTDLWDTISHPTPENKIRFAAAVRIAYYDLFRHYPDAHRQNDDVLKTFFARQVDSEYEAQRKMVSTFKTLLPFGDFDAAPESSANRALDLPELVQSVEDLVVQSCKWLKEQGEIQIRLQALGPLRKRLDELSLGPKERDLLRDSFTAAEASIFRASHVLAWSGLTDFLYRPFAIDEVKAFVAGVRIKDDLYRFDNKVIEAGQKLQYYSYSTMSTLQGLLNDRNRCAHGSKYDPNFNETLGFLEKLLRTIKELQSSPSGLWT